MSRIGDTTFGEFLARYKGKLAALTPLRLGNPPCFQCRCGERRIVKYRGRFYCQRCGARFRGYCPRRLNGNDCSCELQFPKRKAGEEKSNG